MSLYNVHVIDRWPPPEGDTRSRTESHGAHQQRPGKRARPAARQEPHEKPLPPLPPPAPGGPPFESARWNFGNRGYRQSQERTETTEVGRTDRSSETWSRTPRPARPGATRAKQTEHLGAKRQHGTLNRTRRILLLVVLTTCEVVR